jgi:hypothetical protein
MTILKKIQALAAGAAVLCMAGTAVAAEIDLNIYGASAQYLYWNAQAPSFLTNIRGCSATSQYASADGKHGITRGTGCDGNTNNINIRYSAKASYDGPMAVASINNSNADLFCGSATDALRNQRRMIISISDNNTQCTPVHLGVSDVASTSFSQYSEGNLLGPNGGAYTTRSFPSTGFPMPAGVVSFQPSVVPFGMFVNKNVKVYTCDNAATANYGNLCTVATAAVDCGLFPDNVTAHSCTAGSLTNISREMAVQIFKGNISKWSDFGASYYVDPGTDNSLVACLRHAGSGTAAAFDLTVMHKLWGGQVAQFESTTAPIVWFNDSSTDEMKCVNQISGAIGYADADQSLSSYPNVVALKYNGNKGFRNNIRNGQYDWFTNAWLYENTNAGHTPVGSAEDTLIGQLVTFASDPDNIPDSKKKWWATKGEMKYNRTEDKSYPISVIASDPQTP